MDETTALSKMVAPGTPRQSKWRGGVIQICVTSSCDRSCFNCTQASNVSRPLLVMTPDQFRAAVESLHGYFGVVGVFGGNPALSKHFEDYCSILQQSWVPFEQRGVWCNNPLTLEKARLMRATFNPAYSNLNVHLDPVAYDLFRVHWPESHPVGLREDSRHSPPWVAMKDILRKDCGCLMDDTCGRCNNTRRVYDESRAWELISNCDINQRWSAMIGVFRGELRAWFCEVAGAQAMLHQWDKTWPQAEGDGWDYLYPDTGLDPTKRFTLESNPVNAPDRSWWQLPMSSFRGQVRKHCHDCGVPMRGYGELAQADDKHGKEQVSAIHAGVYQPKRKGRAVEVVTDLVQLSVGKIQVATNYLQNSAK